MRVFVTGIGIISPIGCGVGEFYSGLKSGRLGISPIECFDTTGLPATVAGQAIDFDPFHFFQKRELKTLDRFSQFGIAAASMALEDSGFKHQLKNSCVYIGTGIGGISTYENAIRSEKVGNELRNDRAYTIPRIMNNAPACGIAQRFGIKGHNLTINTACSSGANAIGLGFLNIQNGSCDFALCDGTEAPVTPDLLKAWAALQVLSKCNNEIGKACCPFDKERTGFSLSEGAAVCSLESLNSALKRRATIHAEIIGFASNCNADHLTAPSLEGQIEVVKSALQNANIQAEAVDYIYAHGTATKLIDKTETETDTIKAVFGKHAYQIPVSSTKSMTGHAMGASSAIEFVATAPAVKHSIVPPTINYRTFDGRNHKILHSFQS